MKHTLIKKILINILCVFSVASAFIINVSAEEIEHITILGDSISSGYGLSENDKNYGVWLGEYYNAEVNNFAAEGETTQQLMDILESDREIFDSLEKSDLICVSIGGNDILDIFYDDLVGIAEGFSVSQGGEFSISPEAIEKLIISFSSSLGPASAQAGENIGKISDKITEINPEAKIIFQTVYNPFETDEQSMKPVYTPLYTFTSIYLSAINNAVRNNDKIGFADIQNKFKGCCPKFTNISQMDIHPNRIGHLLIAEEVVQQLKIPGENNIFSQALTDMIPEISDVIPENLQNEIEQLAQGRFRTEQIAAIGEVQTIEDETTTREKEIVTKEAEPTKEDEKDKNYSVSIIISVIIAAAVLLAVIIVCIKTKKDNRRGKL